MNQSYRVVVLQVLGARGRLGSYSDAYKDKEMKHTDTPRGCAETSYMVQRDT